jgi:heterodisulfide reductase subunit C
VAYAMDYHPNQIIRLVQLGLKGKTLKSNAIWICVSCEACATRCPNEINIVGLMDILRIAALWENFKISVKNTPKFHRIFVEQIRKRGRIDVAELLFKYKLHSKDLLSLNKVAREIRLGIKMLPKGKLRLPSKAHQQKKVAEIFEKVLHE